MKRIQGTVVLIAFVATLMWCGAAHAQFGGMLKKLGKKAADSASENNSSDSSDSDDSSNKKKESSSEESGDSAKTKDTASEPAKDTGAQPDLVATPIDFVAGEKIVFYDDFTDMPPGEPPPHWKVRGGAVELRMGGGLRELDVPYNASLASADFKVPPNFTLESEMLLRHDFKWEIGNKDEDGVFLLFGGPDGGGLTVNGPHGHLGSGTMEVDYSKPVKVALWVQQGRVRAYLNGKRLVDVNQVNFGPLDHLTFVQDNEGSEEKLIGIRSVRLAESAPDPGVVLASTGKYVTHGILFDTDSDRLKPESAAVIKQISTAMYKNPALKLEIDGYTDSTGDAAHNLDLSKRRAQAVKTVLVQQFGIDEARLSSNGFGADKPIGSNDTAEGKAMNRRVEFVKH